MEIDRNVYHSDITKGDCKSKDHLYELLKIEPASPVQPHFNCRKQDWEFTPNNDKHYIPRKESKQFLSKKVKTVKEIRALLENDVYDYLPDDLEKQNTYLLRKIRDGSAKNQKTKDVACKMFKADAPISRSAWQMLVNINPVGHNHPKQYVLWNGNYIQVNGSRGGKTKFICNYDLKNCKMPKLKNTTILKKNVSTPRIGLLRNSLKIKFKPGPLGKKKFLDDSHHKYQMNHIELAKLPKPVLEISPAYGIILEPGISNFINNLRGETGIISHKLADLAVSVLGTIQDNTPTQLDKESCILFDLNYKCDQNRILMRRNTVDTATFANGENASFSAIKIVNDPVTSSMNNYGDCNPNNSIIEIKTVVDDMLNAVEISLMEDSLYSAESDKSVEIVNDVCSDMTFTAKDKPKRKYLELDKLDVTVIKLPEKSQRDNAKPCEKAFCALGCICDSLECAFNLKQHCGVFECMFGCKCEISKYKEIELLERDCSEIIPGLLNLDNEINSHLAKEEQKFHQTVIVSGEKSIVLKSRKRNCKAAKKYAEFYDQVSVKTDSKIKKILTVNIQKLNCTNVEPFCMVHNLYKCFCKGKFTESSVFTTTNIKDTNATSNLNNEEAKLEKEIDVYGNPPSKLHHQTERKSSKRLKSVSMSESKHFVEFYSDNCNFCARTMGYTGRKYTDGYYKNTNRKILEMEQNDDLLKKKMSKLISVAKVGVLKPDEKDVRSETLNNTKVQNGSELISKGLTCTYSDVQVKNIPKVGDEMTLSLKVQNKTIMKDTVAAINNEDNEGDISNPFLKVEGKKSLKSWLESSYKTYKERIAQGIHKNSLEAPTKGKAALQSWDFILNRYRERKNIFLVTKQEPFHTYIAVNARVPFFENCINIDDIRITDLCKYPVIIRNLITNITESENMFCILRGWNNCWELIGSAVKVFEHIPGNQSAPIERFETQDMTVKGSIILDDENDDWNGERMFTLASEPSSPESSVCNETAQEKDQENNTINPDKSKWFVMTVENDFTEIQFYKRGFYVTYEGIQRSIYIARIYGKTVRLSLQTSTGKNTTHQFGIYAIPSTSESCVFIGPYDMNEPLGIEVVKTSTDSRKQKKTRGVWITTNKFEEMKVIEQPFTYMPSMSISNDTVVMLDENSESIANNKLSVSLNLCDKQEEDKNIAKNEAAKKVKPIKISRTNGFFHLSNNILHKISPNTQSLLIKKSNSNKDITLKKTTITVKNTESMFPETNGAVVWHKTEGTSSTDTLQTNSKPIAEIAPQVNKSESNSETVIRPVAEISPQIKITSIFSQANIDKDSSPTKSKGSTLVLKPEEINKKILANTAINDEMSMDIENFLMTSTICVAPQDEVFVISDCEDEDTSWKEVWIECSNVADFGYIRGRLNDEKLLSFEFPGFNFSEYYPEKVAYAKINQVIARKMYKPQNFILKWQVVEKEENLKSKLLTPECLQIKQYLHNKLREHRRKKQSTSRGLKKFSKRNETEPRSTANQPELQPIEIIDELEETSKELDTQSAFLWNEAIRKREALIDSLNVPESLKDGMTAKLQDIIMTLDE